MALGIHNLLGRCAFFLYWGYFIIDLVFLPPWAVAKPKKLFQIKKTMRPGSENFFFIFLYRPPLKPEILLPNLIHKNRPLLLNVWGPVHLPAREVAETLNMIYNYICILPTTVNILGTLHASLSSQVLISIRSHLPKVCNLQYHS